MKDINDQSLTTQQNTLTLVQSYMQWWALAGVTCNTSETLVNWLSNETRDLNNNTESNDIKTKLNSHSPNIIAASDVLTKTAEEKENIYKKSTQWPKTIDALHQALKSKANLPGNIYNSKPILPRILGNQNVNNISLNQKTIMLISDFPSEEDINKNTILSGKQDELIINMMNLIGFDKHIIYCASLASTRPLYDELPQQDLPAIKDFILHHISLLAPQMVISLGSAPCEALLNAELMKSRGNLHYFNHNDSNSMLITTFHPRSLIAKPQLKRQAWKDLQIIIKKDLL